MSNTPEPRPDVLASGLLVDPPRRVRWYLRVGLWWARRSVGKEPLAGRLLAHAPRAALAAGIFELGAPHGPRDLGRRELAVARVVASAVAGCAFCIDMNASTYRDAGLTRDELGALLELDTERWAALGAREHAAALYARSLSSTPIEVSRELQATLRRHFSDREIVVLATTIAQVNYWARFNSGLGIPSAGFFEDPTCAVPASRRT
jgi:AhpD family alkylhydroperoxidase